MTRVELANRLTAIETELAALKAKATGSPRSHPVQSLEKIHGIFQNDPAFQQAVRLGRQWRQSDRPVVRKSKAKRK